MKQVDPKDPRESIPVSIDFTKLLAPAETITECSFTSAVFYGSDDAPESMISGNADIAQAPACIQEVKGGVSGVTYCISAVAKTDKGHTHVGSVLLPVVYGGA